VPTDVPVMEVVPGDVVLLAAGATAPGDCLLLESRDLFADEATLTGETFPAEKSVGILPADTRLGKRTNFVFLGTHIVSGTGTAVVVATGRDTEFGKVSERLKLRPPETDFEHGVRRFGYLLLEVTLVLVIGIFARSTSIFTVRCWTRFFSPWRWQSGSLHNCCPPLSASTWPRAPGAWRSGR